MPNSDTAASGRCHQNLGFKKGMAIASLNINGLHSLLDKIQPRGVHFIGYIETVRLKAWPNDSTFHSTFH